MQNDCDSSTTYTQPVCVPNPDIDEDVPLDIPPGCNACNRKGYIFDVDGWTQTCPFCFGGSTLD